MSRRRAAAASAADAVPSFVTTAYSEDLRAAFDMFDAQGSGRIDRKHLLVALRALGLEPSRIDAAALLSEVDPAGTGTIDFDGFLGTILRRVSAPDTRGEVSASFALLDSGAKGHLTCEDLRAAADRLRWDLTDAEAQEVMDEVGRAEAGRISRDEFARAMRRTSLM